MLTIRRAQMEALRNHAMQEFVGTLRRHLEAAFPEVLEKAIEATIARAIDFCHEVGLTREKDIARFAEIVCRYLGGFPESGFPPEALSNLYAYGRDSTLKLDRLEEWASRSKPAAPKDF